MATEIIDPANDLISMFDVSSGKHTEGAVGHVIRSGLASGAGITVSFNSTTGVTTVAAAAAGGSAASVIPFAVTAGTATALVADMTTPFSSLEAGDIALIRLTTDIAGPTTINVDGLGDLSLKDSNGSALSSGSGKIGDLLLLVYDDLTQWRVISGLRTKSQSVIFTSTTGIVGPLDINTRYNLAWRANVVSSPYGASGWNLWSSKDNGTTWNAAYAASANGSGAYPDYYDPTVIGGAPLAQNVVDPSSSGSLRAIFGGEMDIYTGKVLEGLGTNVGFVEGQIYGGPDSAGNMGTIMHGISRGFNKLMLRPFIPGSGSGAFANSFSLWTEFHAILSVKG